MKDVYYIDSGKSQHGSYASEEIAFSCLETFLTLPTGTDEVTFMVEYSIISS